MCNFINAPMKLDLMHYMYINASRKVRHVNCKFRPLQAESGLVASAQHKIRTMGLYNGHSDRACQLACSV